jgi:putative flippase GtrA
MPKNQISYNRYPRFFMIGSLVGIATILVRELIASMLGSDGKLDYLITICGAYGFGIIASFTLQRLFTFRNDEGKRASGHFVLFVLVAMTGGALVALLSFVFRYALLNDSLFNQYTPTLAFIAATLLVSVLSYWVNAKYVFR